MRRAMQEGEKKNTNKNRSTKISATSAMGQGKKTDYWEMV